MEVIQICISYIYHFYKDQFVPKEKDNDKRGYDESAHRNVSITKPSQLKSSIFIYNHISDRRRNSFSPFLIDKRRKKD